jgi:hypothetical protein
MESCWAGAELHRLVTQELLAYGGERGARVRIDGPAVMLEPGTAQTTAICLHELATTRQNTDRYRLRMVTLKSRDPLRQTEGSACAGSSRVGRPSRRPRAAGSAHASWKT